MSEIPPPMPPLPSGKWNDVFEPYAREIGFFLKEWNELQESFAALFAVILGMNDGGISRAVWYSISNDRLQRAMLTAAAKARFEPKSRMKLQDERDEAVQKERDTGFQTLGGAKMTAIQANLDRLIDTAWCDTGKFRAIDRERAFEIISTIEESFLFDGGEFEWDAMRGLIDYYSDAERGGDGTVLLLAETGRHLDRARSGDKSGLSVLGTALRATVVDSPRSKPALILLQQEGTHGLGWGGKRFWWPILALPSDVEPCVFAGKTAA